MLDPGLLENKKFRSGLLISAALLFFICRWNDIFLPAYWDEMASYVNGILHLYEHGISLHPSAIPAHTSYGHPLFMHCVMAVLLKIFGKSLVVLHTATVCFTLLTAYATYLLSYEVSKNRLSSLLTFALFLIQPIVVAQSTQVLLEMFLCMLTVLALLFYIRQNHLLAVLFTCLGIMTKETGLVLAIALLSHFILVLFLQKEKKLPIILLALYSVPFIVFASFLLVTKATYGWYLNPVNVGKSKLHLFSMLQKIADYPIEISFFDQGRFVFTFFLVLAMALAVFGRNRKQVRTSMRTILLLIYGLGFILFSSIADTLERYFVMLMPFVALVFASACVYFKRFWSPLPIVLFAIGAVVNLMYMSSNTRYTEVDLGYKHMVKTNKAVFDFVNSGEFAGDTIGFDFPFQFAGSDPGFGYYTKKQFVSDSLNRNASYSIYTDPGNYRWNPPDSSKYLKIKEFHSGYSHSYLFKRKLRN